MAVFRVMVSGRTVLLKTESGNEACGFVKTEYVFAVSEESAVRIAKQRILSALKDKKGVSLPTDEQLELVVDEVEAGVRLWRLATREGFIFFDVSEWQPVSESNNGDQQRGHG